MPTLARRRQTQAEDYSEEDNRRSTQRRRRRAPSDVSSDDEDEDAADGMEVDGEAESLDQLARKLVRYALACEYQRMPISRMGIKERVTGRQKTPFKQIFTRAQQQLRTKFGMEMVELPTKENTTIKGRLKNAKKASQSTTKSTSSYILLTTLPSEYRTAEIMPPSNVNSAAEEASYIGICTVLVSIIALSTEGIMPQRLLDRNLHRLGADMSKEAKEALLKKMEKQGYIYRTVEKTSDDEITEFRVGPRGKVEIGSTGVMAFVKEVYGDDAPQDLEQRLHRSLGLEIVKIGRSEAAEEDEPQQNGESSKRGGRRRRANNDDDMSE